MRIPPIVVLALVAATAAHAQPGVHPMPQRPAAPQRQVPDFGLTMVHHPVSTKNPIAQRAFDQGLALCYGFNHEEAVRSFARAAQLDPNLAMAHWGIALALGPNINLPMAPENGPRAWEALQRAQALSNHASPAERVYLEALSTRYRKDAVVDRAKLDADYADAMRNLSTRYPDDLDAATLFAEAMMDMRPWQYWERDGKPAPGTEEILGVLESVLRRDPNHLGATHYYIHAVEASPSPERARGAAESLRALAPNAGHLMHMPSHIDVRLGDFDRAARLNERAAALDRNYVNLYQPEGVYPAMYYSHNMHFAAYAHAMTGRYGDAMRYARDLSRFVDPLVKDMLMLEMFTPTQTLVQVLFTRWNDLLRAPEPALGLPVTHALWRFGRGMALAATGSADEAKADLQALHGEIEGITAETMIGLNTASGVLRVAERMLEAKVFEARGNTEGAVAALETAVKLEGNLTYDEPPDWYLHPRVALGGLLLRNGSHAKAEQAFRAALVQQPRLGRALFGLARALDARGKVYDAETVQRQFESAWSKTSEALRIEDL